MAIRIYGKMPQEEALPGSSRLRQWAQPPDLAELDQLTTPGQVAQNVHPFLVRLEAIQLLAHERDARIEQNRPVWPVATQETVHQRA